MLWIAVVLVVCYFCYKDAEQRTGSPLKAFIYALEIPSFSFMFCLIWETAYGWDDIGVFWGVICEALNLFLAVILSELFLSTKGWCNRLNLLLLGGCIVWTFIALNSLGKVSSSNKDNSSKQVAVAEDAESMFDLGMQYLEGDGVEKNVAKGIELLTQAAGKGNSTAMNNLGYIYFYGKDVEKDISKGIELLTKAAGKGDSYAMTKLGWIYFNGEVGQADVSKAVEYFKQAAEAGKCNGLAYCYTHGFGVAQDYVQARNLYEKDIAAGWAVGVSKTHLGEFARDGLGEPVDYERAFQLFKEAAEAGSYKGIICLAECYHDGIGTEANASLAKQYFTQAVEMKPNENYFEDYLERAKAALEQLSETNVETNVEDILPVFP